MKEINNDGVCVYVGQAVGPKCYTSPPVVAFTLPRVYLDSTSDCKDQRR